MMSCSFIRIGCHGAGRTISIADTGLSTVYPQIQHYAVAVKRIPSAADLLILSLGSLALRIEVEPLLILVGIAIVIAAVE